jgi:pimeloyl-ACP methyl ester carboxylesterase
MVRKLTQRYESDGLLLDAMLYPPPGELIDIGGRKLHLQQLGQEGPAVVFESGLAASSLSWRLVDSEIARFARVYLYDRAGFGWSPYNPLPKTARNLVEELRLLLDQVGAPKPRILVGHSFGGMMMRMYAGMYPEEVAGVVLVDALPAEEWFPIDKRRAYILRRAAMLADRGAWLARHGVVRFALKRLEQGNLGLAKMFSFLAGGRGMNIAGRVTEQVQKFPPEVRRQIRAHWSRATSFQTMTEYLAELPASCAQAQVCPDLGDKPLIVLSAERGLSGHLGRQAKLAKLSTRGDFRMLPGTTHWLMLDAPGDVIEAVRDAIAASDGQT